jgi:hypothetical protein
MGLGKPLHRKQGGRRLMPILSPSLGSRCRKPISGNGSWRQPTYKNWHSCQKGKVDYIDVSGKFFI